MIPTLILLAATGTLGGEAFHAALALQGEVRPEQPIEVQLVFTPPRPGSFVVSMTSGNAVTHRAFDSDQAGEIQAAVTIPAPPDNAPVTVTLSDDSTVLAQRILPVRKRTGNRRLLLIGAGLVETSNEASTAMVNADVIVLSAPDWPQTPAGYASADLVALTGQELQRLTARQTTALLEYLALCGRGLLSGGVGARWQASAGCGGQYAQLLPVDAGTAEVVSQIESLLTRQPEPLPDPRLLARALPAADEHPALDPALGIVAMVALVLLLNRFTSSRAVLLGMPLLASTVVYILVTTPRPERYEIIWEEHAQGNANARVQHLVVFRAQGRGQTSVELPERSAWQDIEQASRSVAYTHSPGTTRASWQTTLGERRWFFHRFSMVVEQPLEIDFTSVPPTLRNRAGKSSAAAVLAWDNQRFDVPVLAPGSSWQPQSGTPWGDRPILRVFRERTLHHRAGLLVEDAAAHRRRYQVTLL